MNKANKKIAPACDCVFFLADLILISSFWEHSELWILNGVLALANPAYLIAFPRSDRHVIALLLCAELIVPCCAVLCLRQMLDDNMLVRMCEKKAHENPKTKMAKKIGKKKRKKQNRKHSRKKQTKPKSILNPEIMKNAKNHPKHENKTENGK